MDSNQGIKRSKNGHTLLFEHAAGGWVWYDAGWKLSDL
jgi:hypothetical protein